MRLHAMLQRDIILCCDLAAAGMQRAGREAEAPRGGGTGAGVGGGAVGCEVREDGGGGLRREKQADFAGEVGGE